MIRFSGVALIVATAAAAWPASCAAAGTLKGVIRGDSLILGAPRDDAPDEILFLPLGDSSRTPERRALPGCPKNPSRIPPGFIKSERGWPLHWAYGDGYVWAICVCTSLNTGWDYVRLNRVVLDDKLELHSRFEYPAPPGAPRFDTLRPDSLPPGLTITDLLSPSTFATAPAQSSGGDGIGDSGSGACVAKTCPPIHDLAKSTPDTANYDIVPLGPTSCRMYGLLVPGILRPDFLPIVEKPTMFAIDYSFKEFPAPGGKLRVAGIPIDWGGTWKVTESIDVDFTGAFHVVVAGADVYAITALGRVYRKEGGAGMARMRLADIPEQGKVCALIYRADHKDAFAFTDAAAFKVAGALDGPRIKTSAGANPDADVPWKLLRRCAEAVAELK